VNQHNGLEMNFFLQIDRIVSLKYTHVLNFSILLSLLGLFTVTYNYGSKWFVNV